MIRRALIIVAALGAGLGVACDGAAGGDASLDIAFAALESPPCDPDPGPGPQPAKGAAPELVSDPASDPAAALKDENCGWIEFYFANRCVQNHWELVKVGYTQKRCHELPFTVGEVTDCIAVDRAPCSGTCSECRSVPLTCQPLNGFCGGLPTMDAPGEIGPPARPPAVDPGEPTPGTLAP